MGDGDRDVILTYYGVDGACAAAVALLRFPQATLRATSAGSIGCVLSQLAAEGRAIGAVLVCGVGVHSEWGAVEAPARELRERGARIVWYCGRGYLDGDREGFETFATPVFRKLGSNTAAVSSELHPKPRERVELLLRLAQQDDAIRARGAGIPKDLEFAVDHIRASIDQYLKYQDTSAYERAVRCLAGEAYGDADERLVTKFRVWRSHYVLEGRSDALRLLKDQIRACAATDAPVIITGETGVGKEHVARLIHERSERGTGAFYPINCGLFAGNAGLANTTLFGHERGAFTGAASARRGAFQSAHGGTLFLDELADLPLEVQSKFLRVLEDGCVRPEGADEETRVDVRILAATHAGLAGMVRGRRFRSDLFHRLDLLRVRVPPLRDRPDDIRPIVQKKLRDLKDQGFGIAVSQEDFAALAAYPWPGNVRQLIKVVRRAAYLGIPVLASLDEERREWGAMEMGDGESLAPDRLLPATTAEVRPLEEVKRDYARRVLELHGGNVTASAKSLGIVPNTLRHILGKREG